ncbi:ABC transporter permease [Clostridium sp. SYSU_GA19001]|uniref:ABC transporter permease n=1 Tax=Clostridium caldaquaticum TaxID=2940653 RepID=UPI0020775C3E|nr:ABC transporter permease [Clostridium caldaquaticum]MCM8709956.1 ABC transporter permease [Clostridium caldaquaticum]
MKEYQINNYKFQLNKKHISLIASYGGLLFCIVVFTILSSGRLWNTYNLGVLVESVCVYAILALGAVFIYSMGYMDISIGAQIGVYCILIISIVNKTGSVVLGFLTVLILAMICGVINGAVAVWLGLPSIVTSMFLSSLFTGIRMLLMENSGSNSVSTEYNFEFWNSTPVMVAAIILIALVSAYFFKYTKLGKYTKSIGANELATIQAGVNTTRWKVIAYVFLGFCVAVATVFLTARTGTAGKGTGDGYAMDVMVALILGGMPLSGGMKSKISSALIGTFTYVILTNGLTLAGVELTQLNLIKAIIFIVVILLTCRKKEGILPR